MGKYKGMELDISIQSPSDMQHPKSLKDPNTSGWVHESSYVHYPPHERDYRTFPFPRPPGMASHTPTAKDRLFGTRPLEFLFPDTASQRQAAVSQFRLPRVVIVSCLTIRRATFRRFSPKVLFKLLHESFTKIRTVRLEKWLEIYSDQQAGYMHGTFSTKGQLRYRADPNLQSSSVYSTNTGSPNLSKGSSYLRIATQL